MTDAGDGRMTYLYDDAGRLAEMVSTDGSRTTFSYDAINRPTIKELANGTRASYTFDAASRLLLHANETSANNRISEFQFTYDDAGNRLSVLEQMGHGASAQPPVRVTWTYDSIYQLEQEHRSGVDGYQTTFTYDSNGSRLVKILDGSRTTATYDASDQVTNSKDSTGITTYSFDANGNLSLAISPAGDRTTRIWGYENQVVLVELPRDQVVTASYNADNRRVQKLNQAGTKKFIWDELSDNVLLETDENDAVTAAYTNRTEQFGELISQERSGEIGFYHYDGEHSTRDLTDANEDVTDTFIYTSYGEEVARTGTTVNPFGYKGAIGYYTNVETNDVYVRARTYEPVMGCWLSKDPAGFVDGSNLYQAYFVPGGIDPSGKLRFAVRGTMTLQVANAGLGLLSANVRWISRNVFDPNLSPTCPCNFVGFFQIVETEMCHLREVEPGNFWREHCVFLDPGRPWYLGQFLPPTSPHGWHDDTDNLMDVDPPLLKDAYIYQAAPDTRPEWRKNEVPTIPIVATLRDDPGLVTGLNGPNGHRLNWGKQEFESCAVCIDTTSNDYGKSYGCATWGHRYVLETRPWGFVGAWWGALAGKSELVRTHVDNPPPAQTINLNGFGKKPTEHFCEIIGKEYGF